MAQNWDYAELSKAAKVAGGPEKYVEMLELTSKDAGKMEMLPWIGAAAVGASLVTVAAIKVVDYFKAKKQGDSRFYRSGQRAEPAGDEFCRTISILSPFYSFLFCHIFCSDLKIRNRRRENYKSCQIR